MRGSRCEASLWLPSKAARRLRRKLDRLARLCAQIGCCGACERLAWRAQNKSASVKITRLFSAERRDSPGDVAAVAFKHATYHPLRHTRERESLPTPTRKPLNYDDYSSAALELTLPISNPKAIRVGRRQTVAVRPGKLGRVFAQVVCYFVCRPSGESFSRSKLLPGIAGEICLFALLLRRCTERALHKLARLVWRISL